MAPERRSETLNATVFWPLVGSPSWLLWRLKFKMHCEWKGDALTGRKFLHLILTTDHFLLSVLFEAYSIIADQILFAGPPSRRGSTSLISNIPPSSSPSTVTVATVTAYFAGTDSACRKSRVEAGQKSCNKP